MRLSTVVTLNPAAEDAQVAVGQRAIPVDQLIELLPAQPVEVAVGVVGGDDDAPGQQRH